LIYCTECNISYVFDIDVVQHNFGRVESRRLYETNGRFAKYFKQIEARAFRNVRL